MTGVDGLFLGVDVGTSATRVSLVRPDGAVAAAAGSATAGSATAGSVAASAVAASAVAASAVTASAGYRMVLTWQDTRATAEAAELAWPAR